MAATDRGLIGDKPTAAVDGTGLESRHTSRYFFKRAGRKHTSRLWTKLTVAVDTRTHFITGATVATGPSNDSPQFPPVMAQASLVVTWDRVLADAAFDTVVPHEPVRRYPADLATGHCCRMDREGGLDRRPRIPVE